jgi:hypothetical protein
MRGIVFSATGERYVAAALEAASRSARLNPVRHVVFGTHEGSAEGVRTMRFESCGNPHVDKIANMIATPFEETIYLDVDCLALLRITELFDLLGRYDIAAAHAPGYRGAANPEVPSCFYEINTGVVAYRRTPAVIELFEAWRATYLAWLENPPFEGADGRRLGQDQPAFRHCLWRSGIPIYVLAPEYNWRVLAPSFLCNAAKIVHGFVSEVDLLAAKVNQPPVRPRIYPALGRGYGIESRIDGAALAREWDCRTQPGGASAAAADAGTVRDAEGPEGTARSGE